MGTEAFHAFAGCGSSERLRGQQEDRKGRRRDSVRTSPSCSRQGYVLGKGVCGLREPIMGMNMNVALNKVSAGLRERGTQKCFHLHVTCQVHDISVQVPLDSRAYNIFAVHRADYQHQP